MRVPDADDDLTSSVPDVEKSTPINWDLGAMGRPRARGQRGHGLMRIR
jgi:hypothetical protein